MPLLLGMRFIAIFLLFCAPLFSANLDLSPAASFGSVYLNVTSTLTLTLTNNSSPPKQITNISLGTPAPTEPFAYFEGTFPGTGGTCAGAVLNPGGTCTLVYRFLPTSTGSFTGTLALNYKLQNANKSTSFPVSGTGALSAASFSLSHTSFDFLTRPIDSVSQLTITLSNTGQQTATGLSTPGTPTGAFSFLGGSFPGTGGTCSLGGSITGGASCTVVIKFSPSAAQSYSSSLSIGATGVPTVSVNFSGTGQAPLPPGTSDTAFGSGGTGIATGDAGSTSEFITALNFDGDGNAPVAGGSSYSLTSYLNQFVISKYLPDGALDASFNTSGLKTISFPGAHAIATSVHQSSDGKVFIAGHAGNDFAIARSLASGTLDTTLVGTGQVRLDLTGSQSDDFCYRSHTQSDGKIILTGTSATNGLYKTALVRLTNTGALDTSFNGTGTNLIQLGSANSMALSSELLSDGRILVAGIAHSGSGYDMMIARFTSSGTLDTTFNGTGYALKDFGNTADLASTVIVLNNGKYAIAGRVRNNSDQHAAAVVFFNDDGSLFGSYQTPLEDGTEVRAAIKEASNGDIFMAWYIGGGSSQVTIRLTDLMSTLSLRTSFGTNGTLSTGLKTSKGQVPPLHIDPTGRVMLGGTSVGDLALQRYY